MPNLIRHFCKAYIKDISKIKKKPFIRNIYKTYLLGISLRSIYEAHLQYMAVSESSI